MEYISTAAELEKLVVVLRKKPVIGIDTESNNLHTYQDKVCLIQLSSETDVYILDPLAMNNIHALGNVLEDPSIVKIIHGCDYDLRSLNRDYGFEIKNIFDTELAARFTGLNSSNLGNVLDQFLNVKIKKSRSIQTSDWSRRPLSEKALEYAGSDVLYLSELHNIMTAKLKDMGRLDWALEEFKLFENIRHVDVDIREEGYLRLKGVGKLDRRALTILKQLYIIREDEAKMRDVPSFRIVNNDTLVRMSQNPDFYVEQDLFTENNWINANKQWISETIAKATELPLLDKPQKTVRTGRNDEKARKRLKKLREWRVAKSAQLGLQPALIFPMQGLVFLSSVHPNDISVENSAYHSSGIRSWQQNHFLEEVRTVLL